MKIVILDKTSIGEDTPLSSLDKFGEVICYDESNPQEAILRSRDADVIIINKIKVTRELMENAKNLKLICIFATGFDNIDVKSAKELGIAVCNVPGYSTDSVTLFTISTVLALSSHLMEYNDFVRSGEYTALGVPNKLTPVYHDIAGKIWGIIGYGSIGRAVGRVAKALGARVIVYKRTPVNDAENVDLDTLCRESDIITIHCPLNDQSRGLINEDKLKLMKQSVILVNEARGAVLDEGVVAKYVEDGKIAAFGCDVYSTEPFSESHPYTRIMGMKNVILTPHAAWGSYEAREKCINIIAKNITSFIEGESLNRVDK
ncbi:MAG: hydroxyacid dehydrogenase [Ruminococcaceae bacterium]|nr:hydroxyacid dehydrogenase [Oscillospiraceae bacterium]